MKCVRWRMFQFNFFFRGKGGDRGERFVFHLHATVVIPEKTVLTGRRGKLMKIHFSISALRSDSLLHCVFPSISDDDSTLISEQVQSSCMTPSDVSPSHQNCCRMSNDMNSQYRGQLFLKVGDVKRAFEQRTSLPKWPGGKAQIRTVVSTESF